jgi:hypothetical protein
VARPLGTSAALSQLAHPAQPAPLSPAEMAEVAFRNGAIREDQKQLFAQGIVEIEKNEQLTDGMGDHFDEESSR